jgi:hypothetical protein
MVLSFADLRFYVCYNVQEMWDSGVWEFKDGECDLIIHQVGWFRSPEKGEPVHHYVVAFAETENSDMESIMGLADAKRIFSTETSYKWKDAWAFRGDPQELLDAGVRFRYPPMPYTLDDEIYLGSVKNRAMESAYNRSAICCCPVELTGEEIAYLTVIDQSEVASKRKDADDPYSHWDDLNFLQSDLNPPVYNTREQLFPWSASLLAATPFNPDGTSASPRRT